MKSSNEKSEGIIDLTARQTELEEQIRQLEQAKRDLQEEDDGDSRPAGTAS